MVFISTYLCFQLVRSPKGIHIVTTFGHNFELIIATPE